jgi:hypothetical protein
VAEQHRQVTPLSSGGSVCSPSSFGRRSQRSIGASRGEIGNRLQQPAMADGNTKTLEIPICQLRQDGGRDVDEGAVIRSKRGRFLAIPTENAPRKGTDGRRIRPRTFPEHSFGPLRFVPRSSGPSLLVVDGLRASFSRNTGELQGFRRATDRARRSGQGLATVVMFLLVPQVKLRKRLDVARAAERWSGQLPALIEQQLRSE